MHGETSKTKPMHRIRIEDGVALRAVLKEVETWATAVGRKSQLSHQDPLPPGLRTRD